MGRTKGSKNREMQTLIPTLTREQRIQFIAELILDTILAKQQQEADMQKELTEDDL